MKRFVISFLCIIVSLFILSSCTVPEDKVLLSLGTYKEIAYYSEGGIQDFTDYAKYSFESSNLNNNDFLKQINTASKADFIEYIEDFEKWVEVAPESSEVVINYDFDKSIISDDDYLYIYDAYADTTREIYDEKFLDYDVYFYDCETNILYYFHNNI